MTRLYCFWVLLFSLFCSLFMDEFKVSTSCGAPATAMAFVAFSLIYVAHLSFNECRCYKIFEILILDLFLFLLLCFENKCALSKSIDAFQSFVLVATRFMILTRKYMSIYICMYVQSPVSIYACASICVIYLHTIYMYIWACLFPYICRPPTSAGN